MYTPELDSLVARIPTIPMYIFQISSYHTSLLHQAQLQNFYPSRLFHSGGGWLPMYPLSNWILYSTSRRPLMATTVGNVFHRFRREIFDNIVKHHILLYFDKDFFAVFYIGHHKTLLQLFASTVASSGGGHLFWYLQYNTDFTVTIGLLSLVRMSQIILYLW